MASSRFENCSAILECLEIRSDCDYRVPPRDRASLFSHFARRDSHAVTAVSSRPHNTTFMTRKGSRRRRASSATTQRKG